MKLHFGEKVHNQLVGRCQGFTEKGQTIIRKESRKLHSADQLSSCLRALKRLQVEAGFSFWKKKQEAKSGIYLM